MIQKVLSSIGGVENYGVVAVLLFFVVFLGVLVWVISLRGSYLDRMSRMPLEPGDSQEGSSGSELSSANRYE